MIAAVLAPVILSACAPTVIPAGDTVRAPTLTADRYVAADGTALPVAVWPAANGAPTAVVLGLHGYGDYRNAWEEPAAIWSKAGITTYAYDQRGFGGSPTRGRWAGTESLVEDARAMAALLRARHPGVPLYLAGESMGGAVALVAADQAIDVDGLVLLATALRSRDTLGPVASGGLWFFAHTIPWMPSGPTSIDYKPTDNPKALEKLRNDPMMLRQTRLDMGYGLVDLMDAARSSAGRVNMPYLMMHGLGDRIVPKEPVRAAIEIMPRRPDSKLAFYREGYHLLLRDKEGPVVAADIVVWMSDHEAALPSGADATQSQPELAALWGSRRPR
ncbi:MAG: alpha/beta fold hydrolase [Reyranella sp.]|uniref:alpha/beta fold hydrolase n=1 Tax=Reyranella sp. TaxID=1929291 RepID=UPI002730BCC2|nr:alpha/beta fold hydrolase [Reyranella sp.]MDP1966570.1 alpha/beta fold hydrolase [Reyranella sp.]MDP2376699.1 alpha/beta fold hydrolase [Reyranella sp.]